MDDPTPDTGGGADDTGGGADDAEILRDTGRESGPAGSWGGGATSTGSAGGRGAEGGYGGGSTGFDEPPEQGLGGETSTGWGADPDLADPDVRDPAGLIGSDGSASSSGEIVDPGMSDQEIEEQPRGA